ncbi:hypothetical protein B296_00052765 [Ensete ventricosum]|uniref:Uncharacterized protein n=1 Tax=Ensete ventricosum TaxID=4639 RepID=A0A426Y501_ENSVE|nr:hypothetical protein B296_00052765 [Ensete ventricosum]
MRDLCRVKAQVTDEPYMAGEIAELPELVDDSSLKAQWLPKGRIRANSRSAAKAQANEVIAKLRWVQRREAETLEKVQTLETELQGLKASLEVAERKKREADEFLSMARMAREKARATIAQYKELSGFKSGLKKMGWVSYEFGYKIVLMRFQARHPRLEVEEDPYTILLEDDSVPMEVDIPFDDSNPPTV